ncbi:MAG TPA: OB-fold domain-containing protein [Acidimicrobiales bacterium]
MSELFRLEGTDLVLLGGRSRIHGTYHFPLADVCPYTGDDDVEPVDLPRTGTLWLWTAVTSAPPGYEGPVPYGFGVVELDGVGLRVVSRLTEADPSVLREGQTMRAVPETFGEVTTWAFEPA